MTDPTAAAAEPTSTTDSPPPPTPRVPPTDRHARLTAREREIAEYLAKGWKNAEIAEQLEISQKTVDTHRAHVLAKLKLRNNAELARDFAAYGQVSAGLPASVVRGLRAIGAIDPAGMTDDVAAAIMWIAVQH